MGAISLRLPESSYESARELAKKENISINQLITLALREKVSALMAEEYLEKRPSGEIDARPKKRWRRLPVRSRKNRIGYRVKVWPH